MIEDSQNSYVSFDLRNADLVISQSVVNLPSLLEKGKHFIVIIQLFAQQNLENELRINLSRRCFGHAATID